IAQSGAIESDTNARAARQVFQVKKSRRFAVARKLNARENMPAAELSKNARTIESCVGGERLSETKNRFARDRDVALTLQRRGLANSRERGCRDEVLLKLCFAIAVRETRIRGVERTERRRMSQFIHVIDAVLIQVERRQGGHAPNAVESGVC